MFRVRFAPSPTGALHIGGVRTALYNYLLAKKHGGQFILRIEDTDQTRFVEGAEEYIIESLKWLGIEPVEGVGYGGEFAPYRQSERKAIYQKYAHELVAKGNAYYAFDTVAELDQIRAANEGNFQYGSQNRLSLKNSLTLQPNEVKNRIENGEPYVVRLKVPENQTIVVEDLIRGTVSVNASELDDKVLLKADGMPTYHLANVVDDYLMKITHVIRGEEWLPSAAHHVLLYKGFGWEANMPQFAHLPLILKPTGQGKLSKRDGAKFGFPVFPISWKVEKEEGAFVGFREWGFEPQAVLNFLALLGWSPNEGKEILSLDEMAEMFSMDRINKSGARFDFDKAKWFNQQYIMQKDGEALALNLRPFVDAKGYQMSDEKLAVFCQLMKERVVFLTDFLEKGYYFFEPVKTYDTAMVKKKWKSELRPKFERLLNVFSEHPSFQAVELEEEVKRFAEVESLKLGEILPILRLGLSGTMQGPGVFDIAQVIGRAETIQRLQTAYDIFDKTIAENG